MAATLTPLGRQGLLDGTFDLDTHTLKVMLLDLGTADAALKAVTGATNATPIVLTVTANGFANGDTVVVGGVGGNTAANNIWKVAAQATNTITLVSVDDGTTNSVGNGAYTSGGYVINLGPSAAANFVDDYSAARVGTDQTVTSPTVANGVFDHADPTFPAVTGATVEAALWYKSTGAEATDPPFFFNDGKHKVTCAAQASASATTIVVEPLEADIASAAVLVFSNGASATLSAPAVAGARALTVSALAAIITAGSYASADRSGSGLPVTPNGGSITLQLATTGLFSI